MSKEINMVYIVLIPERNLAAMKYRFQGFSI